MIEGIIPGSVISYTQIYQFLESHHLTFVMTK